MNIQMAIMQKAFHRLGVVAAVAWLGFVSLFLMIDISDGQIMQHLGTFSGLVLCAPVPYGAFRLVGWALEPLFI
ncbi:MAG: hypothetical protein WCF62_00785 [Pseudolabrys sp.]